MKWRKLGRIFSPSEHLPQDQFFGFAQSPQALVMQDRVRVYFSTRQQDSSGKFLSHVAFADFQRDMSRLIGVSTKPVVGLGGLGCFDEHGIFPFHVMREDSRLVGYTTGWSRRVSVSADAAIGFVTSIDEGLTFQRQGTGPIVASSLSEPFLVGDAFVKRYGDSYHMWYIFGTRWQTFQSAGEPERVYKIAHATSADGIVWQRDGRQIISDRLNADECQALPTVIYLEGTYHMHFCYREAEGFREDASRGYRIGYARSQDLENWIRDDTLAGIEVSSDGWDSKMQCYPHTFECDGRIYLLYNGNEFGRYGFGLAILEEV